MSRSRPAPGPLGLSLGSGTVGAMTVGVGALVVSALLGGLRGTLSSVAGIVVVLLFFVASLWLVEVANRVDPSLTLPVGLTVYSILLVWLGLLAYGTSLPDRLHRGAFAWTVITVSLGWVISQAVAVWRRRIPYVVVDLPTREPTDERAEPSAAAGQRLPVASPSTDRPVTVREQTDVRNRFDAGDGAT